MKDHTHNSKTKKELSIGWLISCAIMLLVYTGITSVSFHHYSKKADDAVKFAHQELLDNIVIEFTSDDTSSINFKRLKPLIADKSDLTTDKNKFYDYLSRHYEAQTFWLNLWMTIIATIFALITFVAPFLGYKWYINRKHDMENEHKNLMNQCLLDFKTKNDEVRQTCDKIFEEFGEKAREKLAEMEKVKNETEENTTKSIDNVKIENGITQALMLNNEERHEEAIKTVKDLEKEELTEKQKERIHLLLGTSYHALKRFNEAVVEFQNALKISPESNYVKFYLANSLTASKKHDEAIKLRKEIVESKSHDVRLIVSTLDGLLYNYANIKCTKSQNAEIEYFISKINSINPDKLEIWNRVGSYYLNINNIEQAEHYYNIALGKNGNFKELVYSNLAFIYNIVGRIDEAILYIKKSISLKPEGASHYLNMAFSFILKSEIEKSHFAESLKYAKIFLAKEERNDIYYTYSPAIEAAFNKSAKILEKYPDDPAAAEMKELLPACKEKYTKSAIC